jgi:hypothetical protein
MTDVAKLLLIAPLTNGLCPDGGADSYDGPKQKPKGDVSIQGRPGFSSPCDYGSLISPATHQCQKSASHMPLIVLQGSWMMISYPAPLTWYF